MEKNIEAQLNDLMNKNHRKFSELIEKLANTFHDKYNKEIHFKNKEQLQILDGTLAQEYFTSLELIELWIEKCIDEIRIYIKPITYPLFVYLYFELIWKDDWESAKDFLSTNAERYPAFKKEIEEWSLLKPPLNYKLPLVSQYWKSKAHIYIPRTIFNFFIHFLNTNHWILVLDILNKYFERSNLLSKIETEGEKNRYLWLNNSGEEVEKINCKTAIYYNKVNKDLIDGIMKSKGRIKGEKNILSKFIIPFPEQLNDFINVDLSSIKINKTNPPTIGCFTVLNSNNKWNCADITNDGSICACGFKDGSIIVWLLDPDIRSEITEKELQELDEYKGKDLAAIMERQNQAKQESNNNWNKKMDIDYEQGALCPNENPSKFVYELISNSQRKINFYGHTDSVFSVSISTDHENLISGSYDGSIRLWNIHTKSCLAIYKGHFSPILCVKFSPISHYFASGSSDKTARLWAMNNSTALRIFVGHWSDVEIVDFHPNGLYLITSANDKTMRWWALKTGECIRIFVNYSMNSFTDCLCFSNSGKLWVVGVGKGIIIYDLVKMGDPVSIVSNWTEKSITSMQFDNDDNVIIVTTEDYKVNWYDVESILNSEDNLHIDNEKDKKVELVYSYMTKKTTILSTKFTPTNLMLLLGRFDDNDPKIFL